jgi:peptide/nickel transport system substrate-binding protein
MYRGLGAFTAAALVASAFGSVPSFAQKSGGVLRVHAIDSPPGLSMHEEVDAVPARATMGVFNNLVMFDQHVTQNSITSVVPDLATGWSWSEDGTELTFALRQGVNWHDGKSFTAADVKCPGTCCSVKRSTSCGSIRASRGTATSQR